MAENYTQLQPLFSDIADALRDATSSEDKIPAKEFPEKIENFSNSVRLVENNDTDTYELKKDIYITADKCDTKKLSIKKVPSGWIDGTLPIRDRVCSICYGQGKFCAVSHPYTSGRYVYGAYSHDGITWLKSTMPNAGTSTLYWTYVVATNDTVFVSPTGWYTTSSGTVGSCSIIGYSANGASWSTVSAPRSAHWYNAMSDGNKFLITTSTNCYGAYSLDGKSWTSTTPLKEGQFGCYFKGIFYVGDSGEYYCYTEDCINWVQLPYGFKANWGPFAASDEMMIKVMNNGKVAYTFDGVTWVETPMITSNSWASVCYGDGIFLAVEGSDTTTAAYSTNGIDWTILELPEKQNWTCGFGDHKFVILSGCKPTDDDLTSPFIYNDLTLSDKYDITLEVIVMKEDEQ